MLYYTSTIILYNNNIRFNNVIHLSLQRYIQHFTYFPFIYIFNFHLFTMYMCARVLKTIVATKQQLYYVMINIIINSESGRSSTNMRHDRVIEIYYNKLLIFRFKILCIPTARTLDFLSKPLKAAFRIF